MLFTNYDIGFWCSEAGRNSQLVLRIKLRTKPIFPIFHVLKITVTEYNYAVL